MADEEPVGYLGGSTAEDDEVVGYLGGSDDDELPALPGGSDDDELPALPGAEGFDDELPALPGDGGDSYGETDPYAAADDAYGETDPYAAADDAYGETDPYAAADDPYAAADSAYDDYAYDEAATDEGAYDDYGAEGGYEDDYGADAGADDYPTETVDYGAEDDDSPKTISQQDAESIIRQITTKRILPPESGAAQPLASRPQPLTTSGGGLRLGPIVMVLVLLGGLVGASWFYQRELYDEFPPLRGVLTALWNTEPQVTVQLDQGPKVDPEEDRRKKLIEAILRSEARAHGTTLQDLEPVEIKTPAAPGTGAAEEGPK